MAPHETKSLDYNGLQQPNETAWHRMNRTNRARDRNRTCDLRVTSALLYQLSYTGGGLKLAPHRASGNLHPSASNDPLGPETWLQVISMVTQVLLLGLRDVRDIAQCNRNQQTNGQHTQYFPSPPNQR